MTFGINGAELIILILLAVLVLGPEKLPEYTRKLTEWIRTLRRMAEGAKVQFKDETGTDFDEIDWRRYDPRQYDPRRIIREALADPVDDPAAGRQRSALDAGSAAARSTDGTRETLRKDLGAARSERDALREELKDMDPRALFFGSSNARRSSVEPTGAAPSSPAPSNPATTNPAPTGAGSSAADAPDAAVIAGPTAAGTDAAASASSGVTALGTAKEVSDADDAVSGTDGPRPAPFDADAT
ncbi:MAG: twin-arginine translocase TatA/TatE family subunit [Micrococcus sp.]|nr:twin-arginine translocase TatA/TatE family subunit [Micrococcus sp.]